MKLMKLEMYSPVLKVHHEVDFEVTQGRYVEKTVTPLETFCHTGRHLRDLTNNMCKLRGSQPLHLEAFGTLSYFCLPSAFLHPYATCCSKFAVACWRARLCPWHPKKNQLAVSSAIDQFGFVCVCACLCVCVSVSRSWSFWTGDTQNGRLRNRTTPPVQPGNSEPIAQRVGPLAGCL